MKPTAPSGEPWYRHALFGLEVGPTGAQFGCDPADRAFAACWNGAEIAEAALRCGAGYLVLWAKDNEFAYYDSRLVPRAPGLLGRDPLAECLAVARPAGLPLIAYVCVQYPGYYLRRHPDAQAVDDSGRPIAGRVCLRSGYLDHLCAVAEEIGAYGVDGFHFDMLDQGFGPPCGCWCERCRNRFAAEHAMALPDSLRWDATGERVLEFRYDASARFAGVLREHVRSRFPGLTVDFNYHGAPPCSWEVGQLPVRHARLADFVTGECGLWAFGALQTSLAALFLAGTQRGQRATAGWQPGTRPQVVMQRGARTYHDMTTRPVNDLRWEALTLLAHGAQVTIVDKTPFDGSLDPVAYDRFTTVFAEARRKQEHFLGSPVAEVGLYYSAATRDWYGREQPDRYQRSFVGAHKALVYEHVPLGVLLDESVDAKLLAGYPVVYLPGVAVLSDAEVELLACYVRGGGKLLATGPAGSRGRRGEQTPSRAFQELAGVRILEELGEPDCHVTLEGAPDTVCSGLSAGAPFLVHGPAAVCREEGATAWGSLFRPIRSLRQSRGEERVVLPMSRGERVGPAAFVHRVGRGQVVFLPCSPDAAFAGEYRLPETRLLLRNVLRFLHPEPEVEIHAPLSVESVVTRGPEPETLRVHLLGYHAPPQCTGPGRPHSCLVLPSLQEEPLLYRVQIRLRGGLSPYRLATASSVRTELAEGLEGGDYVVRAQVEDVHEVIVLRRHHAAR